MRYPQIEDPARLALANAISMSALIAVLSRHGLLDQDELQQEIHKLRQALGRLESPPAEPS
jgi:hypothetical protein